MLCKTDLAMRLPRSQGDLTLRVWTRADVDLLARWPGYPFPFAPLNLSCAGQPPAVLDRYFASRDTDPRRLCLVADLPAQPAVGYLALLDMDYATGTAGNLVVRLHPAHCDRGLGSAMLKLLICWAAEAGLISLSLDVAAANQRAIRCYTKAGFALASEFWREEGNLSPVDIERPEYAFARPHTCRAGDRLQTRFYQMQAVVRSNQR